MRFAGPCFIVGALLLSASAWSQDTDTADKPYASIVARNMFGLLPIPPPDTNPPAPPVDPPPKITLNGIMTIFGRDQALYKVANKPKPGQQAKEDAYVLSEGERQDNIEVVKINHVDGIVTFNNHGTVQELPLVEASNGAGPSGGSGGGGGPGGAAPGFTRPGSMTPADRLNMIRERAAARANAGNPNYTPPVASPPPSAGIGSSSFQSAGTQPAENNIEDQVMNAAKDMAIIEQNRIATQDAVDQGILPPLPPTMLTPPDATGQGGYPLVTSPDPIVPPTAALNQTRPSSAPIYTPR